MTQAGCANQIHLYSLTVESGISLPSVA